nr:helix-turn-helix transcriptional regulator [Jeotgalibacillus campisalis]
MSGSKLKAFRRSNGLNQYEMARTIGVSLSMYEKVERGSIKASRNFIEKTKIVYPHIDVSYIFFN